MKRPKPGDWIRYNGQSTFYKSADLLVIEIETKTNNWLVKRENPNGTFRDFYFNDEMLEDARPSPRKPYKKFRTATRSDGFDFVSFYYPNSAYVIILAGCRTFNSIGAAKSHWTGNYDRIGTTTELDEELNEWSLRYLDRLQKKMREKPVKKKAKKRK